MSKNCKDLSVYEKNEDNAVVEAICRAEKGLKVASEYAQIAIESVSNIANAIVETEENKKQAAQLIRENCSCFNTITIEESRKHSQIQKQQEQLSKVIENTLYISNDEEERLADYMEILMALDNFKEEIKKR